MSAVPSPRDRQNLRPRPSTTRLRANGIDQLPTALQVLLRFQQTTTVLTLAAIVSALGLYGWTAMTPLQWNQSYQELKALQKTERQLMVNTEAIKHQLTLEANQSRSGLIPASPHQNIFLPEKTVAPVTSVPKAQEASDRPDTFLMPVAY